MDPSSSTRVYLCGRLVVVVDDERLEERLPGRQGRLLFAFLALNRHRLVERRELIEALWGPGSPPEAEAALSALLSKLRRVLGAERVGGRSTVRLELSERAWVDLEAAFDALHRTESATAQERWHDAWSPARVAVHVLARGFLAGLETAWIEEYRRLIDERYLVALDCYARACLGIGGTELAAAERSAKILVEKAPFRESGYRLLMRALAEKGDVAEALHFYERLRRRLGDELGVAPGPETQALHSRLLRITDESAGETPGGA